MGSDTPMETDAAVEDHMETDVVEGIVEEGGLNTDLAGRCADSDDDSYTKTVIQRSTLFSYEITGTQSITDYSKYSYPWEKYANEEGEGGRGRRKEEEGVLFLKLKFKPWSQLLDSKRKREGRWDEEPTKRMVKSKITAASPLPETLVDPFPDTVESPRYPFSSTEVLAVRVEMHECFEKGVSYRYLFKSKADVEELRFHDDSNVPYWYYAMRFRGESTAQAPSYAHVFPKLSDVETPVCFDWVKPTALEGDKQYLDFFCMLMEATEYGHTRDHVLAKAIVLARKYFQKILFFQINIAVQDCMDLLEYKERMKQRYDIYYSIVSQIVLNGKKCKDLVDSIKAGGSGLPYNLTEFCANDMIWESVIENIVESLVAYFRAEQERGLYKEWVCDKVDEGVAQLIIEIVDEQFQSSCRGLYVDLIFKKMKLAQDLGFVPVVQHETAA